LKTEFSVHFLVRISLFESQQHRQTSFSSVWVYPVIEDNVEINKLGTSSSKKDSCFGLTTAFRCAFIERRLYGKMP
jgi:hypothetical protein